MGAENENPVARQRPPTSFETSVCTSTSSRIRKASSDYVEDSYEALARLPPHKKICRNVAESTSPRCVLKEATSVLNLNKHHQSTPFQFSAPSTLLSQKHTRDIASPTLQTRLDVERNQGQDQPPHQHRRTNSQANDDHQDNESNDNKKSPLSFLDLPPEIRNMIYSYALHYPSCANLYKAYYNTFTSPPSPSNNNSSSSSTSSARTQGLFTYSTPTILLLCKDITAECQAILHARPLVIDRLPPFKSSRFSWPHSHQDHYSCANGYNDLTNTKSNKNYNSNSSGFLNISTFIPRRTLQNIRTLNLCIGLDEGPLGSVWAWERILRELFGPDGILVERNRLAKLRILIRLCSPVCLVTGAAYARKESADGVMNILGTFLSSGNPNVFHPPEATLEVWRIQDHHAWRHEYGRLTCAANGRVCFHQAGGRALVLGLGSERGQEAEQEQEKEEGEGEGEDSKSQPVAVANSNANAIAKTRADAKANGKQVLASPETLRTYPDEEMFPGSIMEFVRPLPPFFVSGDAGY